MKNNNKQNFVKRLITIAKEKEVIRIELLKTAKRLALIAREKEVTRIKLLKTAKRLAAVANEKEIMRLKLIITADKLRLGSKKATVDAEKIKTMVSSITDGLLVLDHEWRFSYFSETGAKLIGMRRKDLLGKCIWKIFPHTRGTKFYKYYHEAVKTGQSITFEEYYPEPTNKWFECRCYPSLDGLSVYFRNISRRKQLEEQLRENERKFRTLSEKSNAAMMLTSPVGEILYISPTTLQVFGWPAKDIVGGKKKIFHPEDFDRVQERLRDALNGQGASNFRYRIIGKDKKVRWVSHSCNPIFEGKKLKEIVSIIINIDAIREREEEMRKSQEKFRDMIETTSDLIWETDTELKYIYVNPNFKSLLGYEYNEVVGKYVVNFMQEKEAQRVFGDLAEIFRDKKPIVAYENWNVHKDGELVLLEINAVPVFDSGGNYTGYRGVCRDVTERKKAEEALRASEANLRSFLDNSSIGMAKVDWEHGILYANAVFCKNLGYTAEEITKITFRDFTHPDDLVESRDYVEKLTAGIIDKFQVEKRYIRKDGSMIWGRVNVASVKDDVGKIIYHTVSMEDITERRNAEEKLKELDKLKDDFLSVTTHELRTPLIPIKSQAQLFLSGDYGELTREQRSAVEMILRNEEALNMLTGDLLDIVKIKSRKLNLVPKKIILEDIVTEVVDSLNGLAMEKQVSISILHFSDISRILADEFRITQVVNNLLYNAIKFTPPNGNIEIGITNQGDCVRVAVKDTGIGIEAENIEKLFMPFFQIDGGVERKYRGTGLGLAISKGIIEAHGGKIWAESEGADKGSSFIFTLPTEG